MRRSSSITSVCEHTNPHVHTQTYTFLHIFLSVLYIYKHTQIYTSIFLSLSLTLTHTLCPYFRTFAVELDASTRWNLPQTTRPGTRLHRLGSRLLFSPERTSRHERLAVGQRAREGEGEGTGGEAGATDGLRRIGERQREREGEEGEENERYLSRKCFGCTGCAHRGEALFTHTHTTHTHTATHTHTLSLFLFSLSSQVGTPYNFKRKVHVNFDYQWTGQNPQDVFTRDEMLGEGYTHSHTRTLLLYYRPRAVHTAQYTRALIPTNLLSFTRANIVYFTRAQYTRARTRALYYSPGLHNIFYTRSHIFYFYPRRSYGAVYKGTHKETGFTMAIKEIKFSVEDGNTAQVCVRVCLRVCACYLQS